MYLIGMIIIAMHFLEHTQSTELAQANSIWNTSLNYFHQQSVCTGSLSKLSVDFDYSIWRG